MPIFISFSDKALKALAATPAMVVVKPSIVQLSTTKKIDNFLFIKEVHILEMLLFCLSFMAILVELYGL